MSGHEARLRSLSEANSWKKWNIFTTKRKQLTPKNKRKMKTRKKDAETSQIAHNHTKFPQLNLTHFFVYIGMLPSSVNLLHHILNLFVCLFAFVFVCLFVVAFDYQLCFLNTAHKVINGVG